MPSLPIDITGNRYNKWTVIKYAARKGGYWNCRCDCGMLSEVWGGDLKRGGSNSCVWCKKPNLRKPFEDLTGKVYGNWTAVRPTSLNGGMWDVECTCGTKGNVRRVDLLLHNSKGCRDCRYIPYNDPKWREEYNPSINGDYEMVRR